MRLFLKSTFVVAGGWIDNNDIYYKDRIHAPLADRIEVPDYEDPVDVLSDSSEEYALVYDALPAGKIQRVHSTLKKEFKPGRHLTLSIQSNDNFFYFIEYLLFTSSFPLHRLRI